MDTKRTDLAEHATGISKILTEISGASGSEPLVRIFDAAGSVVVRITDWSRARSRSVTTDLGQSEPALRLPVPPNRPRLWLGLHERWEPTGRNRIRFRDCAVRLYIGASDEEALQFLRLEWVAPTLDPDGTQVYDGKYAGHPHWHIDRAALVGQDEYSHALELLTAPELASDIEVFGTGVGERPQRFIHDCSWLPRMHLPAQAGWMHAEWDACKVPGPHQSEPESLRQLDHWWAGALRYLIAELPKAVPEGA
jgi:hypothetical protein